MFMFDLMFWPYVCSMFVMFGLCFKPNGMTFNRPIKYGPNKCILNRLKDLKKMDWIWCTIIYFTENHNWLAFTALVWWQCKVITGFPQILINVINNQYNNLTVSISHQLTKKMLSTKHSLFNQISHGINQQYWCWMTDFATTAILSLNLWTAVLSLNFCCDT